ncbi:PDZ domain-containing protein [Myxococcus vastator]|uniref:PDZ domain-containing protein n=1 Tax=Myxococcus vastator TaxID=2709664 RepID=UPI0013D4CFA2|nr:PDZ domain-containing protein [Myxococcus vastator]
MFLAVMTSALTSAWLLTAAPMAITGSVTVEPLGFTVQADGEQVTVTRVERGSVAARAGLEPGMRIERITAPVRRFASGPITTLSLVDLHDALIPTWDEPLQLQVWADKRFLRVELARTDPRPAEEFPVIPLPKEQVARLTPRQQAQYHMRLLMNARPPPPRPELTLAQETTAYVVAGALKAMTGGGFTPARVYARATLTATCPGPLEKVVLGGAARGLPQTLLPSDSARGGSKFTVDLPLWAPAAVRRACASTSPPLKVQLRGALHCKGAPVETRDFTATLAVVCNQPTPYMAKDPRNQLALAGQSRSEDDTWPIKQFEVGENGSLELGARPSEVIPMPSKVALVELDAKGGVARRLQKAKVQETEREQRFQVAIDTKAPRTVRLALELGFPDGSTLRSHPVDVKIVTKEEVAEQDREASESYAKWKAFERKFFDAFRDPCANLPATVTWLQAQPEIKWATSDKHGDSFSYEVKGALAPLLFSCHRH